MPTIRPTNRIPALLFAVCIASANAQTPSPGPGHVNYVGISGTPNLLSFLTSPLRSLEQWFQNHMSGMIGYPPEFDAVVPWFHNAYAYFDLYGIQKGSWEELVHPEWIMHDQNGKRLYLAYNCDGSTCAQYAADIANPAFRTAWITEMAGTTWAAGYPGVFIDDVNMNFQVSDGSGALVAPVDSNTGQPMTYDAWRNYVALFLEQARTAISGIKIMENTIWFAGPAGVLDADPAIKRQIATADTINLERGVASDAGLTGGTGTLSVFAFLNYVDRIHAAGKNVDFQEYELDPAGQEYGLASYFLISNGSDEIGDASTTPNNWWPGYDVNLGNPVGPRTYKNGVFERDFAGGKVLLGEPGLTATTVDLGGSFTKLDGTPVSSVTIASRQGFVLQGTSASALSAALPVLNAASQSAGPISPGEVVTLPGSATGAAASGAAISGTSTTQVLFNGAAGPVVAVGPGAVNVVVPFALDLSHAAQVVIRQGQAVTTESVSVAAASPGIFTAAGGSGPGAILNQDFSLNAALNPAAPGSVIMIYATGLGVLSPAPVDGAISQALATTAAPVTATIGGSAADVLYSGAAPGLIAGVMQINIRVPADATTNPAAAISLAIGSFSSPAGVTVSIQ